MFGKETKYHSCNGGSASVLAIHDDAAMCENPRGQTLYLCSGGVCLDRDTVLRLSRDIQQWLMENPGETGLSQSEREEYERRLAAQADIISLLKNGAMTVRSVSIGMLNT